MSLTEFRQVFPEFTASSDATVTYWLGIGANLVNADRWGNMTAHGTYLVAAHFLALGLANSTGKPGAGGMGVISAKSIDKVSASYDTNTGSVDGAGAWNATIYGRQYAQLVRMFGAGGLQL